MKAGRIIGAAFGAALLLSFLACAEVALYGLRAHSGPADAAIVLGAAVFDDQPSPVLRERVRHGVWLLKQGRVRKLLLTGGLAEGDRKSEAEAARDWSLQQGVSPSDLIVEDRSRTTRENLENAAVLLAENQLASVLVVSDPPHMRRAMIIAEGLGMQAAPSPTSTSRYVGWLSWSRFVVREAYFIARCRFANRC